MVRPATEPAPAPSSSTTTLPLDREKRAEAKRQGRRPASDSDSDYDDLPEPKAGKAGKAGGTGGEEALPAGVADDPFFQHEEDPFGDAFFKVGAGTMTLGRPLVLCFVVLAAALSCFCPLAQRVRCTHLLGPRRGCSRC